MDNIKKQLKVLEIMSMRMAALAAARGIPENVEEQCSSQHETLLWAIKELREVYFVKTISLIGVRDYLLTLPIPREFLDNYSLNNKDVTTVVVFEKNNKQLDDLRSILVPKNWEGNTLTDKQIPDFLICERYFATGDDADPNKKMVWFDCVTSKAAVSENMKATSKKISDWMFSIYDALSWEKARRVE